MSEFLEGKAVRKITTGIAVERAAALPPQTTLANLFTVVGGRVLLKQIVGEVTTAIGNVANNTNLEFNPDDSARGDLSAVLDIDNDAIGTLYGITGTAANAMLDGTVIIAKQATELILKPGVIELHCAGSSGTGAIKWTVVYVPIDDGAYVRAV